MKLKTKKIIAREFLIFLLAIFVGLIVLIGTYLYNYVIQYKVDNIRNTISEKFDIRQNLNNSYQMKSKKIDEFYRKLDLKEVDTTNVWRNLVRLAKSDSIVIKWEKVWNKELIEFTKSLGFSTAKDFDSFIKANIYTATDIENHKIALITSKEIDNLYKEEFEMKSNFISFETQIQSVIYFTIILMSILFPLRYFYYSVRWSIKTLKQKSE